VGDFNQTGIFWAGFRKIFEDQISLKFIQWEPKFSMRTDGQTDIKKLTVVCRKFAKAPKSAASLNFPLSGIYKYCLPSKLLL
jgi:hypothetical protein